MTNRTPLASPPQHSILASRVTAMQESSRDVKCGPAVRSTQHAPAPLTLAGVCPPSHSQMIRAGCFSVLRGPPPADSITPGCGVGLRSSGVFAAGSPR